MAWNEKARNQKKKRRKRAKEDLTKNTVTYHVNIWTSTDMDCFTVQGIRMKRYKLEPQPNYITYPKKYIVLNRRRLVWTRTIPFKLAFTIQFRSLKLHYELCDISVTQSYDFLSLHVSCFHFKVMLNKKNCSVLRARRGRKQSSNIREYPNKLEVRRRERKQLYKISWKLSQCRYAIYWIILSGKSSKTLSFKAHRSLT